MSASLAPIGLDVLEFVCDLPQNRGHARFLAVGALAQGLGDVPAYDGDEAGYPVNPKPHAQRLTAWREVQGA
jgi:hypothetical protein